MEKYLVKGNTRYQFITLRGKNLINKETLVTTDDEGRRLAKTTTCGGAYWCPVDMKTGEQRSLENRYWLATSVTKEEGNNLFLRLQIEEGYKSVSKYYKPELDFTGVTYILSGKFCKGQKVTAVIDGNTKNYQVHQRRDGKLYIQAGDRSYYMEDFE